LERARDRCAPLALLSFRSGRPNLYGYTRWRGSGSAWQPLGWNYRRT
jgi:hypothetical protein